jgi:hypothetical protein
MGPRRLLPIALVLVLSLCGCPGADFGLAPKAAPRPPPPSIDLAPQGDPTSEDITLQAFDTRAAEEDMDRRCPDGYVVSSRSTVASRTCRAPSVIPRRTDTPRCSPHTDVVVRFRCATPSRSDEG